ncbi:hypothetical protein PM082_003800 [Marasmius tenuissimus]|nr:hypothetical protein PM082_003800 [Marasmius tenuissimus]
MAYCERCERSFVNTNALEQHKRFSSAHWECGDCDKDFLTRERLQQHWADSPRHIYCDQCEWVVDDADDLDDLEDHYVLDHHYCRNCEEFFDDEQELQRHFRNSDNHHYCRKCDRFFSTKHGLKQHYEGSSKHHYCVECERDFRTENGLEQHRKSALHQSRNIDCCAEGCDDVFVSQGHLYLHLEYGNCPSGINRAILNREFELHDKGHKFLVPLHWLMNKPNCTSVDIGRCWDGSAYQCPYCEDTFSTAAALRQHLASPRHEAKVYRCPSSACTSDGFTALSALRQHIDSETCDAHKHTRTVKALDRIVRDITRSM